MAHDSHNPPPGTGDTPYPRSGSRFQAVLQKNQGTALIFLSARMEEWQNHAEKTLLEFASEAESSIIQTRLFEALNLLRAGKVELGQRYRTMILAGFQRFDQPPEPLSAVASAKNSGLSLLAPEEMDEALTVETLIANACGLYFAELYTLKQRFAVINQGRPLTDERLPAGPHHLLRSFRAILAPLELESKAKLILYALYDRCVLRQLQGLYEDLNAQLKAAGILPHLKPTVTSQGAQEQPVVRKLDRELPSTIGSVPQSGSAPPSAALFDSVVELLSARRSPPGRPSRPPGAPMPRSSQTLIAAVNQVTQAFQNGEAEIFAHPDTSPRLNVDTQFLERIKQNLAHKQSNLLTQAEAKQAHPVDRDTIELVGMLFEYMLNDPLLPNLAKALLSHLHTPYLKLALADAQLLVDSEHPARLLLDALVEAGSQWVYEDEMNRGIFPRMQVLVERIARPAADSPPLDFAQLLTDFRADMETQRQRGQVLEQRAQAAAQGKEKLRVAKQRACDAIQECIADVHLPSSVRRFLTQIWTDRIVFILLRHPDMSPNPEWNQALALARLLVAMFDRNRPLGADFAEISLQIHQAIVKALAALGDYQSAYLKELFDFLQKPQTIREWREAPPSDFVALAQSPVSDTRSDVLTPQEQAMLVRLRSLNPGTWFDIQDSSGTWRHLKLSWLSLTTATCMFVDRAGVQAEVKSLSELARSLVNGRARWVSTSRAPFVQRTLLSIKQALQRSMEATGKISGDFNASVERTS